MSRAKTTTPETTPETDDVSVQGTPEEGGATVNHEGAGHADAMEPYGDKLANSDQVSVHGPTNGSPTVTAPTGAELPAHTGGIDPQGPVANSNGDPGAQGYSRDALLRIASDNDVTVPENATSNEIVSLLDTKHGKPSVGFSGAPVNAKPAPKMVKIYAPNEAYTGTSAGVAFVNGVGETHESSRIEWFRERGYKIGDEETGGDKDAE